MPMHSSSFQAVIFDMDGVIVDSEPRHQRTFIKVVTELGFGDNHGIHFPDYYGTSDAEVWRDFIARHQPEKPFEELLEWRQREFIDLVREEQPLFPGIPALVASLSRRHKLAVASGSLHPVIDAVLALQDLRRYFSAVVSSSDVARGKPAPDIFLHTAERLGVAPGRCVVIEDSAHGVTAGKAAGMTVIAITNTLPALELAHADHVVGTYVEIAALLG